jgi:hypothetical protein
MTDREIELRAKLFRRDLEDLQSKVGDVSAVNEAQQQQLNELVEVVDRMSLAVLGDETLGVKGLIKDVIDLREESMSTRLAKAKWAGAGIALVAVGKMVWELINLALAK